MLVLCLPNILLFFQSLFAFAVVEVEFQCRSLKRRCRTNGTAVDGVHDHPASSHRMLNLLSSFRFVDLSVQELCQPFLAHPLAFDRVK